MALYIKFYSEVFYFLYLTLNIIYNITIYIYKSIFFLYLLIYKMKYILLNPSIKGKKFKSEEKTIESAASDIWSKFSKNIKNFSPEFYFTIKNVSKNKLYHFQVNEELQNDKVKFTINKFNCKKEDEKVLLDTIDSEVMEGGKRHKRHKDSSSSSSSSDLSFKLGRRGPLYNTLSLTYYPSIYGVRNIFIPSFVTRFTPYINVGLPMFRTIY
jgi:hypothetical protein